MSSFTPAGLNLKCEMLSCYMFSHNSLLKVLMKNCCCTTRHLKFKAIKGMIKVLSLKLLAQIPNNNKSISVNRSLLRRHFQFNFVHLF